MMANIVEYVEGLAPSFQDNNEYKLKCEKELHFAIQSLQRNDYLASVAQKNPVSLRNAILNVAAVGISLNPALSHAYLVPRDGQVMLDLSFLGMVKLATDSGAIKLAKAELVCKGDEFIWHDSFTMPTHHFNPFTEDRGPGKIWENLLGGYVVAKLGDGSLVLDRMSAEEILKVRAASKSASKAASPWNQWPLEMIKKALIKRAYKSWPQCDRVAEALSIDNQTNEVILDHVPEERNPEREALMQEIHELLTQKGMTDAELARIAGLTSITELEDKRLPRLIAYLKKQPDTKEKAA